MAPSRSLVLLPLLHFGLNLGALGLQLFVFHWAE
jgi:hypothetical protein